MNVKQWLKRYGSQLAGDDTYVSDEYILFKKNKINTEFCPDGLNFVLTKIVTHKALPMEAVPYERGQDVDISEYARLRPYNHLFVDFGKFHFDYEYIKLAYEILDIHHFTLVITGDCYGGKPVLKGILKFWDEDNEFLGCLSSYLYKEEIPQ